MAVLLLSITAQRDAGQSMLSLGFRVLAKGPPSVQPELLACWPWAECACCAVVLQASLESLNVLHQHLFRLAGCPSATHEKAKVVPGIPE